MNIYFACSITGGRNYEKVYQSIINALQEDGHLVPTAHLADSEVMVLEAVVSPGDVYERDISWIRACDALLAEISTPSHGVGYEVAFALSLGKPVLCIFHEGKPISKMLTGNADPHIRVKPYQNTGEAISIIRSFLGNIQTDCE
jgi:nucleoside 2-deoxyribosyltransferase